MTVQRTARFFFLVTLIHWTKIYLAPLVPRLDYAIQWMSVEKTSRAVRWRVIYPADGVDHLSHNLGLGLGLSDWGQLFKNPRPGPSCSNAG